MYPTLLKTLHHPHPWRGRMNLLQNLLFKKWELLKEIYEACTFTALELENYEEASQEEVWKKAMKEEIKMIENKETWELFNHPVEGHYWSQVAVKVEQDWSSKEKNIERLLCRRRTKLYLKEEKVIHWLSYTHYNTHDFFTYLMHYPACLFIAKSTATHYLYYTTSHHLCCTASHQFLLHSLMSLSLHLQPHVYIHHPAALSFL